MSDVSNFTRCVFCGEGNVPFRPSGRTGVDSDVKEGVVLRCPDCRNDWTVWYEDQAKAS
jgi:hypothetical protein